MIIIHKTKYTGNIPAFSILPINILNFRFFPFSNQSFKVIIMEHMSKVYGEFEKSLVLCLKNKFGIFGSPEGRDVLMLEGKKRFKVIRALNT